MRSYFAIHPGLALPGQYAFNLAPELLGNNDLWDAARTCQPSLLWRVRSESAVGEPMSTADRIESCVGLIDAATRWRTVFAISHLCVSAVRHPALQQALGEAIGFIAGQHPANVQAGQRLAIGNNLMKLIKDPSDGPIPNGFEQRVAAGVATLVQADSDIEAAQVVPFNIALNPFHPENQRDELSERESSIATTCSAILLHEAARRLSERLPQWMYSKMPELKPAGADELGDEA